MIYSSFGGAIGAVAKGASIFSTVIFKPYYYLDVVICAAIGATIGYFVKMGFDYLFKKKKA